MPCRKTAKPARILLLAAGLLSSLLPAAALAADSKRCAGVVDTKLAELPLGDGEVKSIRIIERVNIADEFGPEIFGVDAWVRLKSCSGWLVMNMTAKCFVRQAYTRGDCRVEGLTNY